MDYSLFRPFKRFLKKGYINGFFAVILIASFPMFLEAETLSQIITPIKTNYTALLCVWLGQITIPFLLLTCRNKISRPLEGLKTFNFCFNILYLTVALWLTFANRGIYALVTIIIAMLLTSFFWYIYPIAITETIKHTRSQKRQQELFLRVQKHILIAISIIYTLTSLVIWLIPTHKTQAISVNEAISIAKEYNAKNIPLLVSITTDWSYTKLTNKSKLYQLEQKGMHVITFNHVGNSQTINDWLQTYNYPTTPLNILFTKRHPKGLVLPTDLNQINWENATATFN
jgi:glucan phosphoethanolaminetransferase (alkaline phosphatase superfamily)